MTPDIARGHITACGSSSYGYNIHASSRQPIWLLPPLEGLEAGYQSDRGTSLEAPTNSYISFDMQFVFDLNSQSLLGTKIAQS
jgi:hypothetical protein